jgi:hypothetical protein
VEHRVDHPASTGTSPRGGHYQLGERGRAVGGLQSICIVCMVHTYNTDRGGAEKMGHCPKLPQSRVNGMKQPEADGCQRACWELFEAQRGG